MADIKIRLDELNDPRIDAIIEIERSINNNANKSEFIDNVKTPLYLNPAFYYALAACLGSMIVWGITEPYYNDEDTVKPIPFLSDYLLFGPVAGVLSMCLGITYGISNRNFKQSFIFGITCLGIGLGLTIISTIVADILYGIATQIVIAMINVTPGETPKIKGAAFFVQMCGRGIGWSVVSCGAGLGLGIILKSKKMALNGLAGGIVGGALGGLMFDPVSRIISGDNLEDGAISRAVGIFFVGTLTGFFIGIFENVNKESWLLMLKGPLAGKQFIIFKSPIFLGSAPKCEIYLFKDPHIEPKHANIIMSGKKYILEDLNSSEGTFVNGKKITSKYVLQPEDIITLGETVLKYQEKPKK